ncbi:MULTISPECIES: helix-turn-helix domain-containing protein [Amycolatopsis]|uniref:Helix-turn-helix domain-containing protein n=1 Tax=Amycolatopsis albidoflavus TaxID=102226 RepID=A0ABW5HTX4_9PSEU
MVAYLFQETIVAAARALHLHPNSLRYRLDRLVTLLGAPIRRLSTLASLYFCLNRRGII